ncbi:alpha/beta fold hydrolase [Nonomuraea sp. NPDC050556]|uniref:alpha/beta fold hydrolase n=1 Tax=Nonomuraea sp. NPDC050556 TaxID=3364369 RepID=UPI0037B5A70C
MDDPSLDLPIETHADDAHRLLQAVGGTPAAVFGSSSGGQIALALAAAHPDAVTTVVAHEPPAVLLLPESDPRRALPDQVDEAYRQGGVGAAMGVFAQGAGMAGGPAPESPEANARMAEKFARMGANVEFFFTHIARPAATYVPDLDMSARIVVAVGDGSAGQLAHDTGLELAARLGVKAELVPGGHSGHVTHPTAFAAKLRELLR